MCLRFLCIADVLQKQLSREEKASVLEVTVNSVIAFQDNSVVLLAALATLNSLLKTGKHEKITKGHVYQLLNVIL